MTKEKQVTIKMDVRSAAAVRQILFDSQKGYTYDEVSVPPRISDIRTVIQDIDDIIEKVVEKEWLTPFDFLNKGKSKGFFNVCTSSRSRKKLRDFTQK